MHVISPSLAGHVLLVKDAPLILIHLVGSHCKTAYSSCNLIILEAPLIDLLTLRGLVVSSGTCSSVTKLVSLCIRPD